MSQRARPTGRYETTTLAYWAVWAIGPAAWAVHQNASYASVDWVCRTGGQWLLAVITIATALLATVAAGLAWRGLQAARRAGDDRGAKQRTFVCTAGLAISLLSLAGIGLESLPVAFVDACAGAT